MGTSGFNLLNFLRVGQASLPVYDGCGRASVRTSNGTPLSEKAAHWRAEEATYFVTWRLAKDQFALVPEERDLIAAAVRKFDNQRYRLAAYVVMDDHVHVLVAPLESNELGKIIHSWKSFTANRMQRAHKRSGKIWQDEYFDRIVRGDKEMMQKLDYIVSNPLEAVA